jgi:hypothetical protein
MADGKGHGQDRQAECQSNAKQADAHIGEGRCQDCASTPAKDQPEGTEEFSAEFIEHRYPSLLKMISWVASYKGVCIYK